MKTKIQINNCSYWVGYYVSVKHLVRS